MPTGAEGPRAPTWWGLLTGLPLPPVVVSRWAWLVPSMCQELRRHRDSRVCVRLWVGVKGSPRSSISRVRPVGGYQGAATGGLLLPQLSHTDSRVISMKGGR